MSLLLHTFLKDLIFLQRKLPFSTLVKLKLEQVLPIDFEVTLGMCFLQKINEKTQKINMEFAPTFPFS